MKNARTGSWMITIPAGGLAVAYLFLWFLPHHEALKALSRDLEGKRDFVIQAGGVLPAFEAGSQALGETAAFVATWQAAAPEESELSTLLSRVTELANQSGLTTTRFEPQPAIDGETIRRVPVTYGCTGSLAQVFNFIYELENLPQVIWADGVKIEAVRENTEFLVCEISLVIFSEKSEDSGQAKVVDRPI